MYCTRILSLRKKDILSFTLKHVMERQCIITNHVDFLMRPQYRQFFKSVNTTNASKSALKVVNVGQKLKKFLYRGNFSKSALVTLGYLRYGHIVNILNYSAFYEEFKMPDTFFSWFLVTELHVWMLMVRYMSEGKDGKIVRFNLVEAMWSDIDERFDKLGPISSKIKKKQLKQLSSQFNAALIDYDEGLLSEDKALAAAIWRMFFNSENNNPEQIETVVHYVRKQIHLLDKISYEEIFRNKKLEWIELKNSSSLFS